MSFDLSNICNLPQNYFTPQCNCINPPTYIKNVASNMLSPYYCWYAPCLATTTIKTPDIIQGQLECKITNCSISIDEIKVTGGVINIENKCAYDILDQLGVRNVNINLEKVVFTTQLPVFRFACLLVLMTSALFLS